MDKIKPIVINSKAANKHLDMIKLQHADMLQGITDQAQRVSAFKAELENKNQVADQEAKASSMESNKNNMEAENKRMELENKRKELEIKAQALTMD